MPNRILLRNTRGKRRDIITRLRPVSDATQPVWRGLHESIELFHPILAEALRRHPHLRHRVILAQQSGLLFEQSEQIFGLRVAGIAAGHKYIIDTRETAVYDFPFLQSKL